MGGFCEERAIEEKVKEGKRKMAVEMKSIYRAVIIELKGREGTFDVLAEEEGSQPLIGQVVLEVLDFVVDPRTKTLIPNPRSPETPMIEILLERDLKKTLTLNDFNPLYERWW